MKTTYDLCPLADAEDEAEPYKVDLQRTRKLKTLTVDMDAASKHKQKFGRAFKPGKFG